MMAMAQPYHHPGGMPGQGLPHGHPMGPGNPHGMPSGQPGMAQMQMMGGAPGGPHVNQAMMAGMPQMGPGQQLNPQMAQQMHIQNQHMQNAMNNMQSNPMLRQHMLIQQQRQQQAALAAGQGHPGMMMNPNGQHIMMANGMANPGMQRVNLPPHLQNQIPPSAQTPQNALQQQQQMQIMQQQQQQLQAAQAATQQHQLQQQQQQQHAQQQQQAAHQAMMQQQSSQSGPSPAPSATTQPPMRPPSQIANRPDQPGMPPTSQAQPPQQQSTPVQQQQQPPPQPQPPTMQQPQVSQPPQVPQVSQPQQPQQQPQQQGQSQQQSQQAQQNQSQTSAQQTDSLTPQQQSQQARLMHMNKAQQMARQQMSTMMGPVQGACVLTLLQFADGLSNARQDNTGDDSSYWQAFVARFFNQNGSVRHHLICSKDNATKGFEITGPSLAWYYHLLFKNGVTRIELIPERATEKDLPNQQGHVVESPRTSLVSWYGPAHQVVSTGRLQVIFDGQGKISLFEHVVSENKEFIDRSELVPPANESPDQKTGTNSPKMSKKQQNQRRNTMLQHPGLKSAIERRPVGDWGVTDRFFAFLEVAENFAQMRHIFDHASSNHTSANETLKQVLQKFQNAAQNQQNADGQGGGLGPQGFPGGPPNQRTPGGPAFSSPAPNAHLALPGGNMTASPAMMNHGLPGQGGIAMVANPSQGGSGNPSATASPNNMQAGKKRRASQVKTEDDGPDKAKASPRMPNGPVGNAQKRIKG